MPTIGQIFTYEEAGIFLELFLAKDVLFVFAIRNVGCESVVSHITKVPITLALLIANGKWKPEGSAHERLELLAWARDLAARSTTLDQVLAEMEEMDA